MSEIWIICRGCPYLSNDKCLYNGGDAGYKDCRISIHAKDLSLKEVCEKLNKKDEAEDDE